jgi:DNA-binding MarR family transcriptional regulator
MTSDDDLLRLENQLCFAMVTAARNVVAVYRPILEPLGLTHPQYLVMLALWERAPRSLSDLAAELALEPASASPLVKRLEKDGLVERARSASDERRLDITLTTEGRALRERAVDVPRAVMAAVGTGIDEVASLREALKPFAGRTAPVG